MFVFHFHFVFTKWKVHITKSLYFLSVNRYPHSEPSLLNKWIANVKREQFAPSKKSVLCSDHFEEQWLDRTGQTIRLRDGAVPTIFCVTTHLVKVCAQHL